MLENYVNFIATCGSAPSLSKCQLRRVQTPPSNPIAFFDDHYNSWEIRCSTCISTYNNDYNRIEGFINQLGHNQDFDLKSEFMSMRRAQLHRVMENHRSIFDFFTHHKFNFGLLNVQNSSILAAAAEIAEIENRHHCDTPMMMTPTPAAAAGDIASKETQSAAFEVSNPNNADNDDDKLIEPKDSAAAAVDAPADTGSIIEISSQSSDDDDDDEDDDPSYNYEPNKTFTAERKKLLKKQRRNVSTQAAIQASLQEERFKPIRLGNRGGSTSDRRVVGFGAGGGKQAREESQKTSIDTIKLVHRSTTTTTSSQESSSSSKQQQPSATTNKATTKSFEGCSESVPIFDAHFRRIGLKKLLPKPPAKSKKDDDEWYLPNGIYLNPNYNGERRRNNTQRQTKGGGGESSPATDSTTSRRVNSNQIHNNARDENSDAVIKNLQLQEKSHTNTIWQKVIYKCDCVCVCYYVLFRKSPPKQPDVQKIATSEPSPIKTTVTRETQTDPLLPPPPFQRPQHAPTISSNNNNTQLIITMTNYGLLMTPVNNSNVQVSINELNLPKAFHPIPGTMPQNIGAKRLFMNVSNPAVAPVKPPRRKKQQKSTINSPKQQQPPPPPHIGHHNQHNTSIGSNKTTSSGSNSTIPASGIMMDHTQTISHSTTPTTPQLNTTIQSFNSESNSSSILSNNDFTAADQCFLLSEERQHVDKAILEQIYTDQFINRATSATTGQLGQQTVIPPPPPPPTNNHHLTSLPAQTNTTTAHISNQTTLTNSRDKKAAPPAYNQIFPPKKNSIMTKDQLALYFQQQQQQRNQQLFAVAAAAAAQQRQPQRQFLYRQQLLHQQTYNSYVPHHHHPSNSTTIQQTTNNSYPHHQKTTAQFQPR
ncbi:Oidioi.mRNA.OKI2018_I69.PAR.g9797.t1.cds [Oikopleura dioica]|uniref:Oidioi.mRNA.OKI2018_I69.PAR.g9797.t1.cds n=1 Tax=Oikopleura dioica TaxID=34765 RepID=A0ABN7RSR0_OIKDI|nr:Oidioi.mRNA.OKI2018_I69.PAR.g9797.t1.cds [Oikopleura dioica]